MCKLRRSFRSCLHVSREHFGQKNRPKGPNSNGFDFRNSGFKEIGITGNINPDFLNSFIIFNPGSFVFVTSYG